MKKRSQRGQGMTEYIILVALIAIITIVAVRKFGKSTNEGFNEAASHVQGVTSDMKEVPKH